MNKFNYFIVSTLIMFFTFNQSFGQVQGYYELVGSSNPTLRNIFVSGSTTIKEFNIGTNNNTRARVFDNGQWQINPWSSAGGYISEPSGQANYATFKIRAGGASGLVSYSFQNGDWGQNIQSYVGRAYTVNYAVKWNGADRFYVAGQGWLYANGAWFSSDRKNKENIKPLTNSLEKVLKLNGYSYNFRTEEISADCKDGATSNEIDRKIEIGLLADEVEQVVPEVVRTIDTDNKKAIAYQNIVALLIESTKEQQKMISSLQAQVAKMMAFGGFNGQGQGNNGNNNNGNPNNIIDENKLFTNNPNPFNSSTNINYYLKADVVKSDIKVWDMQGVERKNFQLDNIQGNNSVTLDAIDLPVGGTFIYALIVDGQIIDAKTMVCNK